MKRTKRNKIKKSKVDVLKPVDVSLFELGSENDPCFGKHHDVKAKECKKCGDSEMCLLVKAQNMNLKRVKDESKQAYKDVNPVVEPANDSMIQLPKYIVRLAKKQYSKNKIIRLCKKKFPTENEGKIERLTIKKIDKYKTK